MESKYQSYGMPFACLENCFPTSCREQNGSDLPFASAGGKPSAWPGGIDDVWCYWPKTFNPMKLKQYENLIYDKNWQDHRQIYVSKNLNPEDTTNENGHPWWRLWKGGDLDTESKGWIVTSASEINWDQLRSTGARWERINMINLQREMILSIDRWIEKWHFFCKRMVRFLGFQNCGKCHATFQNPFNHHQKNITVEIFIDDIRKKKS